MPDVTKWALRVPSVVPHRWVYLRSWNVWRTGKSGVAERTHAGVGSVTAGNVRWVVQSRGLRSVVAEHTASYEINRVLLDEYLLSLGAECVPEEEWPAGGTGVGPREEDRTPYRDWVDGPLASLLGQIHVIRENPGLLREASVAELLAMVERYEHNWPPSEIQARNAPT